MFGEWWFQAHEKISISTVPNARFKSTDFITIAIPRTPILEPIPTINPSSARGWADIATCVTQFGLAWGSIPVGISTSTFHLQLKNIESKINTVSIDACTEHARQLVICGLDNIIYGLQLIFDNPNDSQVHDVMVKGWRWWTMPTWNWPSSVWI